MDSQDYKPNCVLLTGGAGFIGSHVLALMVPKYPQCRFICLDRMDYSSSPKNIEPLEKFPNFKFIRGDITSADLVIYIMKSEGVDTVLHFAAQSHVDRSFGNSFQFTMSNIYGTHVLLESAKNIRSQIRRFIHVSTDEVYGENILDEKFAEGSPLKPTNPYAATKASAEMMVNAYINSFQLPCIITRGNNVYGSQQYPEKLIPKFIMLLGRHRSLPIHGDGSSLRSFIHVDDVARAFDCVLRKGEIGAIYNIGTSFEISVLEVARTLLRYFGLEKVQNQFIDYVRDRDFNDRRYHIDNQRLISLGWTPQVDWSTGIESTIDWYLKNQNWYGDIESVLLAHPQVKF